MSTTRPPPTCGGDRDGDRTAADSKWYAGVVCRQDRDNPGNMTGGGGDALRAYCAHVCCWDRLFQGGAQRAIAGWASARQAQIPLQEG
jgi:hypothetical protein